MVVLQTRVSVEGITGKHVTDFFINCTDADYQRWWEGTHLEFHTTHRTTDGIGSLVYFDEYVGTRRLKLKGIIMDYVAGQRIVYRMVKGFPLPAWLAMDFQDRPGGVDIVHTLKVGFQGIGRILDPVIRLRLSDAFEEALNEHVQTEFPKLADLLR